MSQPTGGRQSIAPPHSPVSPGPARESNVSSSPRPSQSQALEDSYRLDTIYSPPTTSGLGPNVDIVAVHGLSEDADSTWVFTLPARTKGGSGSAPGKRDTTFIPAVETIKESGAVVGNFVKSTVTTAAKPFSSQPQQPTETAQFGQQPAEETSRQDEGRAKPPHVQSSNASLISGDPESGPSPPAKVNWLKDNNMLPRCFPRARIMQFSYPTSLADTASNNLKAVASELLRRLSDERKDCGPGLSRPIIFIGHSFGGIVVSEALVMAKEGSYSSLASATAGLVFCIGNTFSRIGSASVTAANKDTPKVEIKVSEVPCKFNSSEDSSYLLVKDIITDNIGFTTTRRLWDAISTKDAAEVKRQISKGADVNRENSRKQNALHLATEAGDLGIVKLLLDQSVEVNAKDIDLQSPIRQALRKGKYDIVRALLKRGALADDEDKEIASDIDAQNASDKKFRDLLDNITYFEGPRMDWVEPQSSVLKGNGHKDTVLFMPYLHFETNEGRIRLSNAVKRTAIDLARPKKEDDATSVSAESDSGASTRPLFTHDDDDPSESESDGDHIKEMAEHKLEQFKGGSYSAPKKADAVVQRYAVKGFDKLGKDQNGQLLQSKLIMADRHSKIFAKLDVGWDDEEDFVKTIQKTLKDKSKKEKRKDKEKAKQKAKQKKGLKESQLHIKQEVELLVEIQDIRDELNIIKMVLDDQHSVLTVPDSEENCKNAKSEKHILHATFPNVDGKAVDSHVNANRKTIEHMTSRAGDVYSAVYHLIDLKQKQANITEARYARKEAKSAAKEGRTILALTIVNMIFLPLSFMASFFALDIAEFPKDPETGQTTLHLRWVAQYVFGISLAIAIPSIAIAMAIGPMADFTKRLGRKLGYWGVEAVWLILVVLFLVLVVALVPVAAGLIIAAGGVALAAFILYSVALIVFYMCKWIWECTPWYRSREAQKRRERSDPEVAARNVGPESPVIGIDRNGEGEEGELADEKGTRLKERGLESQYDSGNCNEIE
ncbi:hypothetical protein DL770_009852 [Monosporascus sp. CRB-9-2]|nr:hypothetical protein DL770_009852 [Monosporascus sp. CRB-9-2]